MIEDIASIKAFELTTMVDLCRECGKIALKYYRNLHIELKEDQSVVTQADCEIERFLQGYFDQPQNGCYLIGEETLNSRSEDYLKDALTAECCFVVDPIDGTAPYTSHFPAWGISIGLLRNGRLSEGAIFLPTEDELLITHQDQVFCCHGLLSGEFGIEILHKPEVKVDASGNITIAQLLAKHGRITLPNQVFAWCSCVAPFFYLCKGKLLGMVVAAKLYDIAGGMAIMGKLNFYAASVSGRRIDFFELESNYITVLEDKRCWKLVEPIVCGVNKEAVDYILSGIKFL